MKKYFFDNKMIIVPKTEGFMLYSSALHKSILLSNNLLNSTQKLISNEYINEDMHKNEELKKLISILEDNGFIFSRQSDYKYKNYNNKYKMLKLDVNLRTVYLHITQRCNLNCSYCYDKHNLNPNYTELNLEQWKLAIKKLHDVGVNQFIITGGEPLLFSDIIDLLAYVKQFGNVTLLTNATLLESKRNIYKYVDKVIISLDSLDQNENNRSRENSLKYKVIETINKLNEIEREVTIIRSVVTLDNQERVDELSKYLKNNVQIKHIKSLYLPNSIDEIQQLPSIDFFDVYEKEYFYSNLVGLCPACITELAINSNGDIYPCQSLIKEEFKINNILTSEWYDEYINHRVTEKFININVNEISKCSECVMKYLCGGGCRAIVYNTYKNLIAHNDFMCNFLYQEALFRLTHIKFCKEITNG